MTGSLVSCYAITQSNFVVFCFGTFLLGVGLACVQQYRFAAMESVPQEQMGNAAAKVLLGGLGAAIIGPELALLSKDIFVQSFAGAYLSLGIVYIFATLLLFLYRPNHTISETQVSWSHIIKYYPATCFLGRFIGCHHRLYIDEFYYDCYTDEHAYS
jgi:hypothetical protein